MSRWLWVSVWWAASPLAAAEPPEFVCRWTDQRPVIDGQADDAAWSRATVIDRFGQPWAEPPTAARAATRVRCLWDAEALYVLAEMDDRDLYAPLRERDGRTWENDVCEIFLKPHTDRPAYYEFQVTPRGTRFEMLIPERSGESYARYARAHEFEWQAAVQTRGTLDQPDDVDEGWVVEAKIPWSDLRHTGRGPEPDAVWSAAFCRYDYLHADLRQPELSTAAPLTRPSFHRWEDYARLRFTK